MGVGSCNSLPAESGIRAGHWDDVEVISFRCAGDRVDVDGGISWCDMKKNTERNAGSRLFNLDSEEIANSPFYILKSGNTR